MVHLQYNDFFSAMTTLITHKLKEFCELGITDNVVLGCIVAILVGLSTIIWHTWVDPGNDNNEEQD